MEDQIEQFIKYAPKEVEIIEAKIHGLTAFRYDQLVKELSYYQKIESTTLPTGVLIEQFESTDYNLTLSAFEKQDLLPDEQKNILFKTNSPIRLYEKSGKFYASVYFNSDVNSFIKFVKFVYNFMLDSPIPYSNSEKDQVLKRLLATLSIRKEDFNFFIFPPVKDLTLNNIVNIANSNTGYAVSPKADGYHKLLFSSELGVWLIVPGMGSVESKFQKISHGNFPVAVLEGESISYDSRFLAFDVLYYQQKIKQQPYTTRLRIVDDAVSALKRRLESILSVEVKYTLILYTKRMDPKKAMQNLFDKMEQISVKYFNYTTDGFIFTPINVSFSELKNINDKYAPKILKWKPPEKLTIDFTFKDRQLYTSRELFKAPDFDPEINVDWDSIESQNLPEGAVVELSPIINSKDIVMTFTRYRYEKSKGNTSYDAKNLWSMIKNPTTLDVLTGKTFTFVRKYHNRLKNEVISKIPKGSFLVDIGSGRGGDLNKWKDLSKILAIEPNVDNANEFIRRMENMNLGDQEIKLLIDPCCADFDFLISEFEKFLKLKNDSPPLYISMMLSLSFFWKDEKTLQELAKFVRYISTLYYKATSKHITFIYFTVIGDNMRKLFETYGNDVQLGPASIRRSGEEILIDIDNSIVTEQTEYFVDLENFFELTGMHSTKFEYADQNALMSRDEQIFTKLYGFGSSKSTLKSLYLLPGKKLSLELDYNDVIFNLKIHGIEIKDNVKHCFKYFNLEIETNNVIEISDLHDLNIMLIYDDYLRRRTSDKELIMIYIDRTGVLFPVTN